VLRAKRPAEHSIAIDAFGYIAHRWRSLNIPTLEVIHGDALQILPSHPAMLDRETLVYVDAPYLRSVRTRSLYAHEFDTDEQHTSLLTLLQKLPCMVMVSHYPCSLYATMLETWRSITFPAMTRGGVRTEQLWMNFPEPSLFHDPRWCGEGFREREYVKRKRNRWVKRLAAMKPFERQIIRAALDDVELGTASPVPAIGPARGRNDQKEF
jgi:DNA adenine methylase